MRKLILSLGIALSLTLSFVLSASAHTVQRNSNASGPIPQGVVNSCPAIVPKVSNVSRSSTVLSYDLLVAVKNTCTQVLTQGGLTLAFQLDCSGLLIDQEPDINRNLPSNMKVGQQITLVDQHFNSFCEEGVDVVAPDMVNIFATANGSLANGGTTMLSTTIEIQCYLFCSSPEAAKTHRYRDLWWQTEARLSKDNRCHHIMNATSWRFRETSWMNYLNPI